MKNEKVVTYNGVGFFGLLGIAFIVLKLCKVINWSWWLVTLPLWGVFVLAIIIIIIMIAYFLSKE